MSHEPRRIVIIGASAAGLRCASRLRRLEPGWRVTVVEQRQSFSFAACGMPYVLSGDIASVEMLQRTLDGAVRDAAYFADVKGVEVMAGYRATEIDAAGRTLRIVDTDGERERTLEWDELVLATGGRPRHLPDQPDHPRVHTFHALDDIGPLHDALSQGKIQHAVLIGAGFLGCELAEAFRALWGVEVTLIEAAVTPLSQILDPEVGDIVTQVLRENGVQVIVGVPVDRILANDDQVTVLAGDQQVIGDVAVVALGVEPRVELARQAGVAMGTTGAIAVDERLQTSVPHIWAAGDAIEVRHAVTGEPCYVPLGSLANRQGRTLANVLAGREDRFPPVAGAASLKVFDSHVAAVGITREHALRAAGGAAAAVAAGADAGRPAAAAVWLPAHDAAHYWPEAQEIAIQLVYDPRTRRVLGAQAVGEGEVVKRIDVATQLIARGATLEDFAHLEHAYSPPHAPALEPLAVAAMVAQNREDGIVADTPRVRLRDHAVLDVRHPDESESRPVVCERLAKVPHEELRARLGELRGGDWLVVCERGTRSAEAVCLLRGEGIAARYLGGGLRWRGMSGKPTRER